MLYEDINCLNEFIRLIRTEPQPRGKSTGRFRDLQVRIFFYILLFLLVGC